MRSLHLSASRKAAARDRRWVCFGRMPRVWTAQRFSPAFIAASLRLSSSFIVLTSKVVDVSYALLSLLYSASATRQHKSIQSDANSTDLCHCLYYAHGCRSASFACAFTPLCPRSMLGGTRVRVHGRSGSPGAGKALGGHVGARQELWGPTSACLPPVTPEYPHRLSSRKSQEMQIAWGNCGLILSLIQCEDCVTGVESPHLFGFCLRILTNLAKATSTASGLKSNVPPAFRWGIRPASASSRSQLVGPGLGLTGDDLVFAGHRIICVGYPTVSSRRVPALGCVGRYCNPQGIGRLGR